MNETTTFKPTLTEPKMVFDLDTYFGRIGYSGPATVTLDTFRSIHFHHALAIPFENLNPLLRIPVQLDIDSIYTKLVLNGRGGYCFEHNLLLAHVLKTLGFKVKGLAARVLWNVPEEIVTARGHMLLLVEVSREKFIADVGFGALTLTAPLLLSADIEQETPHEPFRLVRLWDDFVLQAKIQQDWKRVYSFGMQENFLQDYEVTSWYLSNHPSSHFVNSLIVGLPFEKGRFALRNNEFATHHLTLGTERKTITNTSDLIDVLAKKFKITLPNIADIQTTLSRFTQFQATR
jgi:N-hydroxyarylamine O-acetyltransferase